MGSEVRKGRKPVTLQRLSRVLLWGWRSVLLLWIWWGIYLRVIPTKGSDSPSLLVRHMMSAAPWSLNSLKVLACSGCTRSGLQWPKQVLRCSVGTWWWKPWVRCAECDGRAMTAVASPLLPASTWVLEVRSRLIGGENGGATPYWEKNPTAWRIPIGSSPKLKEGRRSIFEWNSEFLLLPELSISDAQNEHSWD